MGTSRRVREGRQRRPFRVVERQADILLESNNKADNIKVEDVAFDMKESASDERSVALQKPFKTIDEQIGILNARGLQTDKKTACPASAAGPFSLLRSSSVSTRLRS